MRFCLLNTFFPPYHFGGDAVYVASLSNLLAENGHHVEVVHSYDAFRLLSTGVKPSPFPLHPKVIVHTLRSSIGALAPLWAHCTGGDLAHRSQLREILGQGFDVTHWNNVSLLGAPEAFRWGSGVRLMTLHEYWLVCPSHVLFRNGTEVCTKRTCHSCTIHRKRPPQFWRDEGLVTHGLDSIDLFVAPSVYVRDKVHEYLPQLPIDVLPNFLPDHPVEPERDRSYYLVVSRLERAKGVQTIIPVFLRNGLPLKIAGAGRLEPELREMAKGAPNIEFLGRVPFAELPSVYAGAKATIVPSICNETFGLAVLESLQQNTPVFASSYGALPAIVEKTKGGKIYHSPEELDAMLGTETAVNADLTAFRPDRHLVWYLERIMALKSGRKSSGRA